MKKLLCVVCLSLAGRIAPVNASTMMLWYAKPATDWEKEALPVGNGRLGAMVFGGVGRERIQVNEDSMWTGDANPSGSYGSHRRSRYPATVSASPAPGSGWRHENPRSRSRRVE